jgi:hypothetical protein
MRELDPTLEPGILTGVDKSHYDSSTADVIRVSVDKTRLARDGQLGDVQY